MWSLQSSCDIIAESHELGMFISRQLQHLHAISAIVSVRFLQIKNFQKYSIRTMSSNPVSNALSYLGLSQYVERFEEAGFDDLETALEITETDLYERSLNSQTRS